MSTPDPNTVLIIRPDYDTSTRYGSYYFSRLRDIATSKGYTVIDLEGEYAIKEKVEQAIRVYNPMYILGEGHGCPQIFTGQDRTSVSYIAPGCIPNIHTGSNVHLLKGRKVYFLSCETGRNLGKRIAKVGADFIGFSKVYLWVTSGEREPSTDKYARAFFEVGTIIPIILLEGGSIADAKRAADEKTKEWIAEWSSVRDLKTPIVISLLRHNKSALVAYKAKPKIWN